MRLGKVLIFQKQGFNINKDIIVRVLQYAIPVVNCLSLLNATAQFCH